MKQIFFEIYVLTVTCLHNLSLHLQKCMDLNYDIIGIDFRDDCIRLQFMMCPKEEVVSGPFYGPTSNRPQLFDRNGVELLSVQMSQEFRHHHSNKRKWPVSSKNRPTTWLPNSIMWVFTRTITNILLVHSIIQIKL